MAAAIWRPKAAASPATSASASSSSELRASCAYTAASAGDAGLRSGLRLRLPPSSQPPGARRRAGELGRVGRWGEPSALGGLGGDSERNSLQCWGTGTMLEARVGEGGGTAACCWCCWCCWCCCSATPPAQAGRQPSTAASLVRMLTELATRRRP
jgi:hypothetical protein